MSIPDAAGIIAIRDAGYTATLMTAGVGAWVGYDYLLTVGRESRLFWRRKVNAASILFYTNRYLALFYYVALAYYRIISFPFPECLTQYDVDIGIRYMEYLPWAVFSALRVYALSHKNWALSVFTFFCSVIALPLNYYGDFHHTSVSAVPALGCVSQATTPSFLSLIGSVVIRGGQIIADAIVIGVTWKATYQARSERSMSYLMTVMFKNGTIYFVTQLLLNVLHLIFIFLPDAPLHTSVTNTSYVKKFSEPITAILISYFLLDLQEVSQGMAQHGGVSESEVMGSLTSIDFGPALENRSLAEEPWSVSSGSSVTLAGRGLRQ